MNIIQKCHSGMILLWNVIKPLKKKIFVSVAVYLCVILAVSIHRQFTTKVAYYLHKDTGVTLKERIKVNKIGFESDIQSFMRSYLSGSKNYNVKIPFTYNVRVIGINHSQNNKVLVLNWNSYFYKVLEDKQSEKEIELLLLTLKNNFNVDIVYFLVEGAGILVKLEKLDLGMGIELNKI